MNKSQKHTKTKLPQDTQRIIARLNVMDDIFFHKIAEDLPVCEEILRIILDKPDLQLIEAQPQRFLRNFGARSVILDLFCIDSSGKRINVEIQTTQSDNYVKRMRYNSSNIDTLFTEKGISFQEIPDLYLIFISDFDIFKDGKAFYQVERRLRPTNLPADNGIHEIYINTAINNHSPVAELMQYFKDSSGFHPAFPKLCNLVDFYKHAQKEVLIMCEIVEEYAKNYAKEYAVEYAREYAENYAEETFKRAIEYHCHQFIEKRNVPGFYPIHSSFSLH